MIFDLLSSAPNSDLRFFHVEDLPPKIIDSVRLVCTFLRHIMRHIALRCTRGPCPEAFGEISTGIEQLACRNPLRFRAEGGVTIDLDSASWPNQPGLAATHVTALPLTE